MKLIIFVFIPLILSIGITPVIPFSNADATTPSSKLNSDTAFTAATFADKYNDVLFTGKRVNVVIKMVGEPENSDPAKKAKEIRYLQSYVLKFLSFSNAVNVVSNPQENEITAQIDSAWIPILEQRSDVISVKVIDPTSYQKGITSKIWLITSGEFGCSQKNQDAIEFLQSISFVYFTLYGMKSEFDTSQCLHLNQVEIDPENFLYSLQNYDLPIIVFDSQITSNLFSLENNHHLKFAGYEKPHIVFSYGSIPAKSHTATWELSHQLSHFILDFHGEGLEISKEYVHEVETESVNCINIRRQEGLCSSRWTPVFGDPSLTMMTVKIHPAYLQDLNPIEQLSLSKELRGNFPEPVFRNMIYDLVPNIDLKIKDLKIIPMIDKPKDPLDDSDVIVIQFEITNQGIDYFVLNDKMFEILVLDPSFSPERKPQSSFIIDNYSTLYDIELETRYDDYHNLEIFENCEFFNDRILINQTKTFGLCFDVLRKLNNEVLNIDGPKHYFLTLMDNTHNNSCPNCIHELLSIENKNSDNTQVILPIKFQKLLNEKDIVDLPFWFQTTIDWHIQGHISESELIEAIHFILRKN